MIKLIALDIDGVMTDGTKIYGLDGIPYAKKYCDKDFTAIKRFKASDIVVCFISGDIKVNENMAKNRNIDFFSSRGIDKVSLLPILEEKYRIHKKDMVYVGDDLFDINIMKSVGYCFCPQDACEDIKSLCGIKNTLSSKGGNNVICDLYNVLIERQMVKYVGLSDIEELDKQETF
jgi:YrbI family 3-deoxy-D-manno-octulosonate 8-phosphate phosphatase